MKIAATIANKPTALITDPSDLRAERKLPLEVGQMKHQPGKTDNDINQADDGCSKWTLRYSKVDVEAWAKEHPRS